ncbi:MAG: glycoside hydrolase family 3 N-terminal domain-containing protein [Ornithinimicrobium sp.]
MNPELVHQPWQDTTRSAADRVSALLGLMTLEEKVAQLGSVWEQHHATGDVAPMEDAMSALRVDLQTAIDGGLGHLTRIFGSAPVKAADGVAALKDRQRLVMEANRFGVPAIAHEECLTGFTTFGATVYPTALAWGATFDPALVTQMAHAIGEDMAAVGVHQGLSPVLDVVRDPRWGRVEETMGEDPHLVATLGTAYVTGLQSAGVHATLKHFAGYAASRGARNHAPVSIGPRELADVVLPPFEMAVRDGAVASVMNSYADIDGIPPAADRSLLTDLLRGEWGFTGTVVSDYWAVMFLEQMHHVSGSRLESAVLSLSAGMDVELPETGAFATLPEAVRAGAIAEEVIDRAVSRVLLQKVQLGLLDPGWAPTGDADRDLDSGHNRAIARSVAERSVVLLSNDGVLPVGESAQRIGVIGPGADDARTMMGCYAFPNHVVSEGDDLGVRIDTVLDGVRAEFGGAECDYVAGCEIDSADDSRIDAAVELAERSDLVVLTVGDLAGLFGRGTSGEGCDREDLRLPGVQQEMALAVLGTKTPVVLVVLSGRPYALGELAPGCAAILQVFFPGVEGAAAIAGVLSGRTEPSGRLPIGVPRTAGGQPTGYRAAPLGVCTEGISNLDPSALFPFGHGLSYSTVAYEALTVSDPQLPVDGEVEVRVVVRNTGERPVHETVQLYLSDVQAQVARPVVELVGFAGVDLSVGQAREVKFSVHADRTSFTGVHGQRVVEPGTVRFSAGPSSAELPQRVEVEVVGELRTISGPRVMDTPVATVEVVGERRPHR